MHYLHQLLRLRQLTIYIHHKAVTNAIFSYFRVQYIKTA